MRILRDSFHRRLVVDDSPIMTRLLRRDAKVDPQRVHRVRPRLPLDYSRGNEVDRPQYVENQQNPSS